MKIGGKRTLIIVTALLFTSLLDGSAMAASVSLSSSPLVLEHVTIVSKEPYSEVKSKIEKLGRLDECRGLIKDKDIEVFRACLARIAGPDGLAIHYIAPHGDLLALKGQRKELIAYYIGNVLSAVEMTNVNPAAGLYAPLRVVVYANKDGGTTMEYDKPSTVFDQFKDVSISEMGRSLDSRLLAFLTKVGS